MKKIKFFSVSFLFAALLFLNVSAEDYEVKLINNRDYFTAAFHLIENAENEIKMTVYQGAIYPGHKGSFSNLIFAALSEKASEGLDVQVIIEATNWNITNSERNKLLSEKLKQYGVQVFYDSPEVLSHNKLIIIDNKYTFVGSHNHSFYAQEKNNEASVLIKSEDIAQRYINYFYMIRGNSYLEYPLNYEKVTELTSELNGELVEITGKITKIKETKSLLILTIDEKTTVVCNTKLTDFYDELQEDFFKDLYHEKITVQGEVDDNPKYGLQLKGYAFKGKEFDKVWKSYDLVREKNQTANGKEIAERYSMIPFFKADTIKIANNRTYFTLVNQYLNMASDHIKIAMVDARYYPEKPEHARKEFCKLCPWSLTNNIRDKLISLLNKGIFIDYVYDKFLNYDLKETAAGFLKPLYDAGAVLYQDPSDITTHCKLITIDGETTIVGSTNWSYYAVEENNESAVIIESSEITEAYEKYIDSIAEKSKRITSEDEIK